MGIWRKILMVPCWFLERKRGGIPNSKNMNPFTGHVLPIWMYRKYRIQLFIAYIAHDFVLQNILVILRQMQDVSACCLEDLPGVVVVGCTPTTENSRRSKHNRHRYVRSIKTELGAIYVYILPKTQNPKTLNPQGYLESSILHRERANKVETNWSFPCMVDVWPSTQSSASREKNVFNPRSSL